jgi:hypothetical protein
MRLPRSLLLTASLALVAWAAADTRASADGMKASGGLVAHDEAHKILERYRSIPGDGMKASGGLVTHDEAHKIFSHYRSIPGDGMKASGGLVTHDEAHKIFSHYRSIPGDGMKASGGLVTHDDAHKLFKHYRSIPGDGMKGSGGLVTHDEAHKLFKHYRSIPGDGMKASGGLVTHDDAHKIFKHYRSIPGDGMKGSGGLVTHDEAHKIFSHYRSIPGDGMKGSGGLVTHDEVHKILEHYRSIPGDGMKASGGLVSHDEAHKILEHYRSIPGGVVLEGVGSGIGRVKSIHYEPGTNAFVLDKGRATYVSPLPPEKTALLARALAKSDKIGVSLGEETPIVFGKLPRDSDVAADLMMADNFLGDMVLPPQEWTHGYKFANGFEPPRDGTADNAAVFFRFKDFAFALREGKLALANAHFDASVVPVLDEAAPDGGYMPDFKALASPATLALFQRYEVGARHVADNISYYLGEEIVHRTLAYGEVAAFFRGLKASGVDLGALASKIETSAGTTAVPREPTHRTLEESWLDYLKQIQAGKRYANWSAPPYDLYRKRLASRTQ